LNSIGEETKYAQWEVEKFSEVVTRVSRSAAKC